MVPKPTDKIDKEEHLVEITQGEVDSLARKLEEWSKGLPIKDQELLKLILARAESTYGMEPPEGELIPLGESIEQATISALRPLMGGEMIAAEPTTRRPWSVRAWVRENGPSWMKWSLRKY